MINVVVVFLGLIALSSSLQQRKLPLISINIQSCSLTQKSLHVFNTALMNNSYLLKSLQILNLSGNRIKEENVRDKISFIEERIFT